MKPLEIRIVHRLSAALQKEMDKLRELLAEASSYSVDTVHPRIIGSLLHDFYTGLERAFQKICKEIEGEMTEGRGWHKALLENMSLEIPEVRPRVITEELANDLDDYLRFRHLFRGIYGFELDVERMRPLFDNLGMIFSEIEAQLQTFLNTLTQIAQRRQQE